MIIIREFLASEAIKRPPSLDEIPKLVIYGVGLRVTNWTRAVFRHVGAGDEAASHAGALGSTVSAGSTSALTPRLPGTGAEPFSRREPSP